MATDTTPQHIETFWRAVHEMLKNKEEFQNCFALQEGYPGINSKRPKGNYYTPKTNIKLPGRGYLIGGKIRFRPDLFPQKGVTRLFFTGLEKDKLENIINKTSEYKGLEAKIKEHFPNAHIDISVGKGKIDKNAVPASAIQISGLEPFEIGDMNAIETQVYQCYKATYHLFKFWIDHGPSIISSLASNSEK